MNVIQRKNIFLGISAALILTSIAAISFYGLRLGPDFEGGTLWQIRASDVTTEAIRDALGATNALVYAQEETNSFLVRLGHLSEDEHRAYRATLTQRFAGFEELSFETIGPAIGRELRNKAIVATFLVMLGISLYVAYAFRKVSYPIRSWKYGIVTLLTLLHDVVVPLGFFAVLSHFTGIEVDINLIVALLVIMGFSVHDTIVVFDRVRENLLLARGDFKLSEVINGSIRQTFARSVNTSLTLILVLVAMFFFGPASLQYFVLTIMVGVILGTYSSIFIASPALLSVSRK